MQKKNKKKIVYCNVNYLEIDRSMCNVSMNENSYLYCIRMHCLMALGFPEIKSYKLKKKTAICEVSQAFILKIM